MNVDCWGFRGDDIRWQIFEECFNLTPNRNGHCPVSFSLPLYHAYILLKQVYLSLSHLNPSQLNLSTACLNKFRIRTWRGPRKPNTSLWGLWTSGIPKTWILFISNESQILVLKGQGCLVAMEYNLARDRIGWKSGFGILRPSGVMPRTWFPWTPPALILNLSRHAVYPHHSHHSTCGIPWVDGDEEGHGFGGENHRGELACFLHVRQGTPDIFVLDCSTALHWIHRVLVTGACPSNWLNINRAGLSTCRGVLQIMIWEVPPADWLIL